MQLRCEPKYIVIAFPFREVEKLGVTSMTLADRSCKAQRNRTHWFLQSHMTSCGSISHTNGKKTSITNIVSKVVFIIICVFWYAKCERFCISDNIVR